MCTLYERIIALCEERGVTGSRVCLELGLSKSTLSDIKNGRKKGMSTDTVQKFANYFGVSIEYLLGNTNEKAPAESSKRSISDDEIKFALFGGGGEITDAMLDEVRSFAAFIKRREEEKGKKE